MKVEMERQRQKERQPDRERNGDRWKCPELPISMGFLGVLPLHTRPYSESCLFPEIPWVGLCSHQKAHHKWMDRKELYFEHPWAPASMFKPRMAGNGEPLGVPDRETGGTRERQVRCLERTSRTYLQAQISNTRRWLISIALLEISWNLLIKKSISHCVRSYSVQTMGGHLYNFVTLEANWKNQLDII